MKKTKKMEKTYMSTMSNISDISDISIETQCGVVRDLLPLYHDNVCGAESRAMVEKHVETCEKCRDELEILRNDTTPSERRLLSSLRNIKRKLRRHNVLISLAVLCVAAIVISCAHLYLQVYVTVPYEEGMLSVIVSDDGVVYIQPSSNTLMASGYFERRMTKGGIEYVAVYFRYMEQRYNKLPWKKPLSYSQYFTPEHLGLEIGTILTEEYLSEKGLKSDPEFTRLTCNIGAIYYLEKTMVYNMDDAKRLDMIDDAGPILLWERDDIREAGNQ